MRFQPTLVSLLSLAACLVDTASASPRRKACKPKSSRTPSLALTSTTGTNILTPAATTTGTLTSATPTTTGGSKPDKHVVLPVVNPAVDRSSISNLTPANPLDLFYAEAAPGTYTVIITAKLRAKGVLLENIASVQSVTCSDNQITVDFTDGTNLDALSQWVGGTLLFTLHEGCNPITERGIYAIKTPSRLARRSQRIVFTVEKTTLQNVALEMAISYGEVVAGPDNKSTTTYITTATSFYMQSSTWTSSTYLSTVTPTLTTVTHTSTSATAMGSSSAAETSALSSSGVGAGSTGSATQGTVVSSTGAATDSTVPTATEVTMTASAEILSSVTAEISTSTATETAVSAGTTVLTITPAEATTGIATTTSSTMTAATGTETTSGTFTLSPSDKAALDNIVANLPPPGPDGTITVPIKNTRSEESGNVPELAAPQPYNADPAAQAMIQASLAADKLDSASALLDQAAEGLADESSEGNVTPDMGITIGEGAYEGTDNSIYDNPPPFQPIGTSDAGTTTNAVPASSSTPNTKRAVPAARQLEARSGIKLAKRGAWEDFMFVMNSGVLGQICPTCNLFNTGNSALSVLMCLFGMCPAPPSAIINKLDGSGLQTFQSLTVFPPNALAYRDSRATVLCANCYVKVTSLRIDGKVTIIPSQMGNVNNFLASAILTVTLNSEAAVMYNLRTNGPSGGQFENGGGTALLASVTAPSIFTLYPRFIWGLGMQWETDMALDVQAGAVLTTTNAMARVDIKNKVASPLSSWQPTTQVTYPNLVQPGRLIMSPYFKMSIQISMDVFGQYIENAASVTMQSSMGFDASVLTQASTLKKRDNEVSTSVHRLEERGFLSAIAAIAAKKAQGIPPAYPAPSCAAGSMKLNAVLNTINQAVMGGQAIQLFSQSAKFGSKCVPFPQRGQPTTTAVQPVPTSCTTPQSGFAPPVGSSCFKVKGHGLGTIEGKYLSGGGPGSPTFAWKGTAPGTFYLDGNGYMYEATYGSVMATDRTEGGAWMTFALQPGSMPKAICKRDAFSRTLVCYQTSTDILTICPSFGADDARQVIPMFGVPSSCFQKITLEYEDAACPSMCAESATTTRPASTTTAAPTATCTPLAFVPPSGSKCLQIFGSGAPHIENKWLSVRKLSASPVFGYAGYTLATFYQDPSGHMFIASEINNGWVLATELGAPTWLAFAPQTSIVGGQQRYWGTCSLNPHSDTMGCTQGGVSQMTVEGTFDPDDERCAIPVFGSWGRNPKPLQMKYRTVACPSACPIAATSSTPTPTPSPTSTPTTSTASPSATGMPPCGGYAPGGIVAIDATKYNVKCGRVPDTPLTEIDKPLNLASFADCMRWCNQLPGLCTGVMFREFAPTAGNYSCTRYMEMGAAPSGMDWTGQFDVAYKLPV